jgi:hypothetical protein
LPAPIACCGAVLASEREGKPDLAACGLQILVVQSACEVELAHQLWRDHVRKHRHPILVSLAVSDQNFGAGEVDVLDAKAQPFHHAHPCAVEQPANERVDAV